MQVLIVIIEKDGDKYIGRSPNLLGVSITAKTRDEAETAILDAMDKRLEELYGMHNNRPPISRLPIEESIGCSYKYSDGWREGETCGNSAIKEGLCTVHWKFLYSHPFGNRMRTCPLCGESDPKNLASAYSPCSFKIENPDWGSILEEMKVKNRSEWAKERTEVKLEALQGKERCSKIFHNGNQCLDETYNRGLCFSHYWRDSDTRRQEVVHRQPQNQDTSNYFKNRFRNS